MICGCGREIQQERIDLGFSVCVVCGERIANSKRPFGYIHYGHKTAGAIILTTKAGVVNYKKVSHRQAKGSHMGYASRVGTSFHLINGNIHFTTKLSFLVWRYHGWLVVDTLTFINFMAKKDIVLPMLK